MVCPKCQHKNPSDAKFCVGCGAKLELSCPNCNAPVQPEFQFCKECGHDLSKPLAPSESPTPSPTAPEGERRQATIVFSDLSGYTAMNERLDPEEVQAIMSRIKTQAVRIVESHGGMFHLGNVGLFFRKFIWEMSAYYE